MYFRILIIFSISLLSFELSAKHNSSGSGFIMNKGQILDQKRNYNDEVLFLLSGSELNVQLRKTGFSYEIHSLQNAPELKADKKFMLDPKDLVNTKLLCSRIDIEFEGMNKDAEVVLLERNTTVFNYILNGKEIYNVPSFQKITYKNIYDDIDIVFKTEENHKSSFKYDLILHPGADLSKVKFLINGADNIELKSNEVTMSTALGNITEKIPFSYYADSPQKGLEVKFVLEKNKISFLSQCDETRQMIIDPSSNLIWGTYFGGSQLEYCSAIDHDASDNLYTTGHTFSSNNVATMGAFQTTLAGNCDAFLSKFSSNGQLIWSTYMGSLNYETTFAMYTDPSGNSYITGNTASTVGIASAGAHQTVYGGGIDDAILSKFNTNGQRQWCTYYGGNGHDIGYCISVAPNGDIIWGGHTESTNTGNCIATPGSYNPVFTFGSDGFVAKFTPAGSRIWGTFFGESGFDETWSVDSDQDGNVIFTGFTNSLNGIATFPSYQPFFAGGIYDGFLAKLDPTGANLIWATYIGGIGDDRGDALDVNGNGEIFIGGKTTSANSMTTVGCFQPTMGSSDDTFLARFTSGGNVVWSTYFGGDQADYIYDVLLDGSNNILFCGQTLSTNSISTADAFQPAIGLANTYDAFFAKFKPNGTKITGSYFGSNGEDFGRGITLDNSNRLYLCGETTSTIGLTTPGIYQENSGGSQDAFIAKFCLSPKPSIVPATTASICLNDSWTLTASPGYIGYFWNNAAVTNSIVHFALPQGQYYYTCTVTDQYGCTGTSDSVKVLVFNCITGIDEWKEDLTLLIYPTPVQEKLFVETKDFSKEGRDELQIISAGGQILLNRKISSQKTEIDLKEFAPGVYILQMKRGNLIRTKKIIKN